MKHIRNPGPVSVPGFVVICHALSAIFKGLRGERRNRATIPRAVDPTSIAVLTGRKWWRRYPAPDKAAALAPSEVRLLADDMFRSLAEG